MLSATTMATAPRSSDAAGPAGVTLRPHVVTLSVTLVAGDR